MKSVLLVTLALFARAEEAKLYLQLGHSETVTNISVSRDGRYMIIGGSGAALMWDLATGREIRRFQNRQNSVSSVACHCWSC